MSNTNTGGPAFPVHPSLPAGAYGEGMTLRQYAAIKLKVPKSGTDWLDEMIVESNRNELAAKAMQGLLADPTIDPTLKADHKQFAYAAYEIADAMLKAREQ